MAKVLIAGGGPAGLATGILALKNGLEAEIYEKNASPGGLCASWSRRDYTLSAGAHWLPAAGPGGALQPLLLALGIEETAPPPPVALTLRQGAVSLRLWRDLGWLERELTEISPQDGPEILALVRMLERTGKLPFPIEKPPDLMLAWQRAWLNVQATAIGRLLPYYRISVREYAQNFHHPAIRALLEHSAPPQCSAAGCLLALGRFLNPQGRYLPEGGAALIRQLAQQFQALGGILRLGRGAEKALISGNRVRGLLLRSGKTALADYTVLACDPWVAFDRLLGRGYLDASFGNWFSSPETRPVSSHFSCFFGLEGSGPALDSFELLTQSPFGFPCPPVFPWQDQAWLWVQTEPQGPERRLLRCTMALDEEQSGRWLTLAQNKEAYGVEKHRVSIELQKRIIGEFPQLKGCLRLLNGVTPASYHRITGAYKGSFRGFQAAAGSRPETSTGQPAGLENCFLTGQWLHPPGGLSAAFTAAQFTVQRICRLERRQFQL